MRRRGEPWRDWGELRGAAEDILEVWEVAANCGKVWGPWRCGEPRKAPGSCRDVRSVPNSSGEFLG
eukprot:8589490-Alexandrium_andersonii.AAC.1